MDHSSRTSEEPCMHQHHDFKQEIEDSIRRCEELLSMAPMSYQPPDGKSCLRKSSRSTGSARRSDGRSDVETVSSSVDSDRRSAEVDPEWKKNMGLLINKQDGMAANVSPRAGSPEEGDRGIPFDSFHYHERDESGDQPVEEYNFVFDNSMNSSHEDTVEQSISIRTRTVLNGNGEPSTASDDWAYDHLGQDSTPSTKTSRSEFTSKGDSDRRTFGDPLELEVDALDNSRRPKSHQMDSETQRARVTEVEEEVEAVSCRSDDDKFRVKTTRSVDGDYDVVTTERTAVFPRSVRSSQRSSRSGGSPPRDPPGSPSMGGGDDNTEADPSYSRSPKRINENVMSFSFTIPNQPKYAENWEWLEECKGADIKSQGEKGDQTAGTPAGQIVLEGGRMRIGEPKTIKPDLKRFKVQKKFRSHRDAMNSKNVKSPSRMQRHGDVTQEQRERQIGPIPARLRNLSRPRTDLYQKFAHTRAQLEEEHMSECSFRPKVGRRPNPQSQYSAPLIQRVGGIEHRVDLRKRARKVIEKEELDQCSFWPQINSNSEYLDPAQYKPIEERAMEYQRRRAANLARARAKEDMLMGLTFRPEINPKSVKIFKQTGLEVVNLEDRLTNAGSVVQERKPRELPKSECTFSPEINRNTDLIMRASKLFEGCTPDFLARMKYCMQVREIRHREKSKKFWSATSATFHPKTGNSEAILKDSPIAEIFDQPISKRVDRLHQQDSERRRHIRQKISDAYYAQFTHHPEIDETSRLLGRSATLHDLYRNERGNKLKEQIKASMEQLFEKEHPFQPKLVCRSPPKPSAERMENVLHRRRQFRLEKARVLEEMKVIRELQEFKECTFKPMVNRVPPKEKEPVVVKGLGRHLELQDLAKQMKKDQEEWERKIFFQHVYSLPKRQYTIPKPFSLCAGGRKRASKLAQEAPEDQSGCVVHFRFQDKTNVVDSPTKKGPSMNSFYEESHPTPANPKWKDTTIWASAHEEPRFTSTNTLKELSFRS